MKYDRCIECGTTMAFHAITSVKGEWRRWVECPRCGLLTSALENGTMVLSTRQAPKKEHLARNERYDRDTAFSFGQDSVRGVPELQQDRKRSQGGRLL